MTTDNIFGSLRGTPDVEAATLSVLRTWLPYHLRVLERRHGLPLGQLREPPGLDSYIGSVDFQSYRHDICPVITVVVAPTGTTERNASGYGQWYEIEVGATVIETDEDESRIMAGHYGTAFVSAIAQHGSLGGLATRTTVITAAAVELPDADKRKVALARATFHSFIDGLVDETAGPNVSVPPDSPQAPGTPNGPWSDFPTVVETPITFVADPPG